MLIKFKKPDPRAGMTVRMDSSRGQHFIDTGHADRISENGEVLSAADVAPLGTPAGDPASTAQPSQEQEQAADENTREEPALAFVQGTVAEVVARIDGADKALIEAALAAETASAKPRKGVTDALSAALTPPQPSEG